MATYEENLAQMSQPYQFAPLPIRGGGQGRAFTGLLGNIFGGGGATGLEEYLTAAQTEQMNRQALLQAAIAASQASAPSTVPRSFMQILGAGLAGGQQGYQQAQQGAMAQLMTKMKLDEARRAQQAQLAYQNLLMGQPTVGAEITPQQAISAPGMALGPTNERAAMIGQPAPSVAPSGMSNLTREQRLMLSALPAEKGIPEMLKLTQPTEKAKLLAELGMQPTLANLRLLEKPEADPEKIRILKALNMDVTLTNLRQLDKPESAPPEVQLLNAAGVPVTFENIIALKRSGASNVNVDTGQKGFENKMSAKKTFMSEPIYKDYNDMKASYGQVISALDQGSPIGDVAGATKIMKLLDPGSVVRETELGIAMAASGRMDRLKYYFDNWASGNKLTPTQRNDFKQLSNELYAAAGQAYNQKRAEYLDFGSSTGVELDKALGAPANIPSIVRTPGVNAPQRMPMTDIFKRTP